MELYAYIWVNNDPAVRIWLTSDNEFPRTCSLRMRLLYDAFCESK